MNCQNLDHLLTVLSYVLSFFPTETGKKKNNKRRKRGNSIPNHSDIEGETSNERTNKRQHKSKKLISAQI